VIGELSAGALSYWPMPADHNRFTGFSREAIQFLADLTANNERAWFEPRKGEYERLLRKPMQALCAALSDRFTERGIPLRADPRKSPFRVYRDTRFSRDKSPYKTNLAARFPWTDTAADSARDAGADSARDAGADSARDAGTDADGVHAADAHAHGNGGYFSFAPGEMYIGGGMWRPERPRLEAFRRIVRDEPDRVRGALEDAGFLAWYDEPVHSHEELKRVPPGYPADHPLAHMFRWKDVIFSRRLSDREVLSARLPDTIADGFAAAMPVLRFLAQVRP
jgi:uncharacterized protein (DUF2461 family)